MILCIDPGSRTTGWVILEPRHGPLPGLADHGNTTTAEFLKRLRSDPDLDLTAAVIEHVGHYGTGMPAGADVFDTCMLSGRMQEILESGRGVAIEKIRRQTIKTHLCCRATANKSNVRQAVIDRWGGAERAIGGKKCQRCKGRGWRGRGRPTCTACGGDGWDIVPGPLHGVSDDAWDALAAGVYYWEVCR